MRIETLRYEQSFCELNGVDTFLICLYFCVYHVSSLFALFVCIPCRCYFHTLCVCVTCRCGQTTMKALSRHRDFAGLMSVSTYPEEQSTHPTQKSSDVWATVHYYFFKKQTKRLMTSSIASSIVVRAE